MIKVFGNSFVCSIMILVVVQPGDQLLSPERQTDTPKVAREDGVHSHTQSKSQDPCFLTCVFGDLDIHPQKTLKWQMWTLESRLGCAL